MDIRLPLEEIDKEQSDELNGPCAIQAATDNPDKDTLRPRSGPFGSFWLQTEQDPERPIPTFIPMANKAAEWFAHRTGGIAQSSLFEALFNIPTTAHIMGGAVIAPNPELGVVDAQQRVYGYENLLICDGAAIPANVGVNPSLTITALAEHAMSYLPPAPRRD